MGCPPLKKIKNKKNNKLKPQLLPITVHNQSSIPSTYATQQGRMYPLPGMSTRDTQYGNKNQTFSRRTM